MRVIDSGHQYEVTVLDENDQVAYPRQVITFVKRDGMKFPGNVGHYPGTNLQEVFRVCLDRVAYLENQVSCEENKQIQANIRDCIRLLEERAAKRHNRNPDPHLYGKDGLSSNQIEFLPTCRKCGHVGCDC